MAHHNIIKANSYNSLVQRLNIFPQGAPPSELLFKILKVLFSEREAKIVSFSFDKKFQELDKINFGTVELIHVKETWEG